MRRHLYAIFLTVAAHAAPVPLFDGRTLEGWDVRPGEEKWWRVVDGMIQGGSLEETVPHNTFLATLTSHANFELKLKVRLVKGEGFMNSGVQIRSTRVPDDPEMSGYQVDAGPGWWGKLYDESRRNRVIAEPVDPKALVAHDWDWNEYRILCEGPRIRTWINGVAAVDFTETDSSIPLNGRIGLQAHGGGKVLAQFKDITLEVLPEPGKKAGEEDQRSPETERASFTLPENFEVELVASENEGVGKPVTMAWDHAGRLWTMTALEYPVDANENEAQAEALYRSGGKDRVLVFDEPWKPGPQTPRVFADGLAIPLGLLPWKDGALVQHGSEIRYYRDRNRDGRADGYETLLTGFGIQDSHLFPHQFERTPGGWFYLAQGLFNYSKVRRPDGAAFAEGRGEIPFNQCKLARARLDGSAFELLTAGPNNIWGFAVAKDGSEFLQEANDLGHPVSEFIDGTHYPTGSQETLRLYAPELPPSTPGQPMGGTGLSGLALAEDGDGAFSSKWPGEKVFYLANPITNRIQIVTRAKDGSYLKRDDFMVSTDEWFRPVSVQFGPDGCLYIADWYNKIISHNEVPRNHPERDKTRGRIWRVKPKGAVIARPPDLTALPAEELATHLGGPNGRVGRMAWAEFGDRADAAHVPLLAGIAGDASLPLEKRLGALWAIRDVGAPDVELLLKLSADPDPAMRREAVEAAGDLRNLDEAAFLRMVAASRDAGSDFAVECALANALLYQAKATPAMAVAVAGLAPAPVDGDGRDTYEASFLRYLVRRALDSHPEATASALEDSGLSEEARRLCVLALPPDDGAPELVRMLPSLTRPLDTEELGLLGSRLSLPDVAAAFGETLADPAHRETMLASLLRLDSMAAADEKLGEVVGKGTSALLEESPERLPLVLELARRFRLKQLAPAIRERCEETVSPAERALCLRTLTAMGASDLTIFARWLDDADPEVAREAAVGCASSGDSGAVPLLAERWSGLPGATRQLVVNGLSSRPETAKALAREIAGGGFAGFDPSAVEKLAAVLGADDPDFQQALKEVEGLLKQVLRLPYEPESVIVTGLTLEGPFTVETWIKLEGEIDNRDALLGKAGGGTDINFYDGRLRLWNGSHDVVTASHAITAGRWTHCAVTRDGEGIVRLFLDGEPAGISSVSFTGPFESAEVGRANRSGGTAADLAEFRIWDIARSPEEIQRDHAVGLSPDHDHLVFHSGGTWMSRGLVRQVWTADFPKLVTPAEALALEEKFDRYRAMASKQGDAAAGKQLFHALCLICHQASGEGVAIGPDLSGAGAMGEESLLRNILTPNAQLESGYYRHDVSLMDGALASGFLASETPEAIVLRQIGGEDLVIRRDQVKEHTVSRRSLMPEGLIDGFTEQQVADLFAHLRTLR